MDILALLGAIFDISDAWPGSRVTVKDRYAMKKKVRELKRRERESQAAAARSKEGQ